MASRSNWNGYLKLSLVSASIAIYPATSSSEKGDPDALAQRLKMLPEGRV